MSECPALQPLGLGVVLLAAGASVRMGRPKLLLPWGSSSILGHLIGQWLQLGARQLGVVCARGDNRITGELDRLSAPHVGRIINSAPELGMFSSIQAAAQWAGWDRELTHWAIVLGDQPHVPIATLRCLIGFTTTHPQAICQPSRAGRPRHPVLLPRLAFEELSRTRAQNLKEFLRQPGRNVLLCEIDDAALDLDLDTPADYERATRMFPADG